MFLSPHFDDVAFSCGGAVSLLGGRGCRMYLVTVFSGGVHPAEGFALECQTSKGIPRGTDYMELRDREDQTFAGQAALTERLTLGFLEAPHRGYTNPLALFGSIRSADAGIIHQIGHRIGEVLGAIEPTAVWIPIGCGRHVDHRICAASALAALRQSLVRRFYYFEVPYVLRAARARFLPGPVPPRARWRWIDVTARAGFRTRAFQAYPSQLGFQLRGLGEVEEAVHASGRVMAALAGAPVEEAEALLEV